MRYWRLCLVGLLCWGGGMPRSNAANFESALTVGTSADFVANASIIGMSSSAAGIFENPAGLIRIKSGSASLFSASFMNEVTYQNAAVGVLLPFGFLGVGYMEAGVSNIPHTGVNSGNEFYVRDWYDYKDSLIRLAYQANVEQVGSFGVAVTQYSRHAFNATASGMGVDVGYVWQNPSLECSVFLRHLLTTQGGMMTTYENGGTRWEDMPLEPTVGLRYFVGPWGFVAAQYTALGRYSLWAGSVRLYPIASNLLAVNAGLKQFLVDEKISHGFTMGVSLELMTLSTHYAYEVLEDHPEYNGKHYVSVSFDF
ncbi:hypothetical protein EBZ35_02920 [bacterium]|nr:hypothetical protein [bacterium]